MEFKTFERYVPISEENADYARELTDYCKSSGHRPAFHLIPPCGLLNDPNGLAYYQGAYHVFYQWYPFGPTHGMKHWGHYVSKDLVSYEASGAILVPDQEYEKNGCYSGNALQIGDDLFLYYTANYKTPEGKVPKQAVAFLTPEGKIHKYEKNPIIDGAPEGMSGEIRDPFVFSQDGIYYMLLGGKSTERKGKLLLYASGDGLDWEYKGNIALDGVDCGRMIECPGIVHVDGKDVLFISLMGLAAQGDRYRNEFTTLYLIGQLDLANMRFHTESSGELDKGFDFYAPQAFYDKDGKPVYFAWFGCGVQDVPYMQEDMWVHGLTMPRKLSIQDGKLIQSLYEETAAQYDTYTLQKGTMRPSGNSFRLQAEGAGEDIRSIRVGEEDDYFQISIDKEQGRLTLDRSHLKKNFYQEFGEDRSFSFPAGTDLRLDLYYDNTFAELFVNGGEEVVTFRAFPDSLEICAE